jgi:hypothetical protein
MKEIAYSLIISKSEKELAEAHNTIFQQLKKKYDESDEELGITKDEIRDLNRIQALHLIYYIATKLRKEVIEYLNDRCAFNIDQYQSCETLLSLLVKDKDPDKELLKGGLADHKPLEDYDQKQLAKGLHVEGEHTNVPMEKLEISADHLEEAKEWLIPKYYDLLEEMEEKAKHG